MGQQQILFLLLGVCIIGIMVSVGLITSQSEMAPDNRQVLIAELHQMASEAQLFRKKPMEAGGGEGTFLGLLPNIESVRKLTPNHSTAQGDFFVRTPGGINTVELMAVGIQRGLDSRFPVRVAMTVWADSVAVQILN